MGFKLKAIRSKDDYQHYLEKLDELMDKDPDPGSDEFDLMEVIAILIEEYENKEYENKEYKIESPDLIEAIKIRMADKGMKQSDLAKLLGSSVIASEILNRKRKVPFETMKVLNEYLDIPEKLFFHYEPEKKANHELQITGSLINELIKKKWLQASKQVNKIKKNRAAGLSNVFNNGSLYNYVFNDAANTCYRKSLRSNSVVNQLALKIWQYKALEIALQREHREFDRTALNSKKLRDLAKLSSDVDGILESQRFLADLGIILIILPHLKKTYIDGAAMLIPETDRPVISLTLRHDRIDNYWFTLFHEIGHICKHLGDRLRTIFDDLDILQKDDRIEREANNFAGEHLIPQNKWQEFYREGTGDFSPDSVKNFASEIEINPAIVAGRIRSELNNYRILTPLVGYREVRKVFGDQYYQFA